MNDGACAVAYVDGEVAMSDPLTDLLTKNGLADCVSYFLAEDYNLERFLRITKVSDLPLRSGQPFLPVQFLESILKLANDVRLAPLAQAFPFSLVERNLDVTVLLPRTLADLLTAHGLAACVSYFLAEEFDLDSFGLIQTAGDLSFVPDRFHQKIMSLV